MGTLLISRATLAMVAKKKIRLLGIQHQSQPNKNYRGFDPDINLKFIFNTGFVVFVWTCSCIYFYFLLYTVFKIWLQMKVAEKESYFSSFLASATPLLLSSVV
jgi:hypothetical protein